MKENKEAFTESSASTNASSNATTSGTLEGHAADTSPQKHTSPKTKNASFTQEYQSIMESLQGDAQGRLESARYMKNSTAIVHDQVVSASFIPRLFDAPTYQLMKEASEKTHAILCKVMNEYLKNETYREIFSYDERIKELILVPRNYDAILPFARVDAFIDEDSLRLKYCEFNADGSSGMNENREISNSLLASESYKRFAMQHNVQACELFDAWVEEFIGIYETYKFKCENPRFAICDYLDHGVVAEFRIFAEKFKERGIDCVVEDVRALQYDGKVLTDAQGKRIDAVWRRCVSNDVMEFYEESSALLNAYKDEHVALIGGFAGHIVHDKQIFSILFHDETRKLLTEEENAFIAQTVPFTAPLTSSLNIAEIKKTKDKWIIKPTDHYAADNVYAGVYVSQQKWEELIDAFVDARAGFPFILQEYVTPHKTLTCVPESVEELEGAPNKQPQFEMYNNLSGLYLYNGHFQGVFSRLGPLPTISKDMKGITSATLWVDC